MKTLFVIALLGLTAACGNKQSVDGETFNLAQYGDENEVYPVAIDVTKRERIGSIADFDQVKVYASTNSYYHVPNLRAGMPVFFSASYGVGGEAGQARGVLVEKDGKLFFKQTGNPTNQLLLAPGNPFNGNQDASLWDMEAYVKLINRVAFSDPNEVSRTATDVYPTAGLDVYKVDFKGGTAGGTVDYKDALEVGMKLQESGTDVKLYYAQGIGPVALEFRERSSPDGTFKVYIGSR